MSSEYNDFVSNEHETDSDHIDKPEPRWQALLAFVAVGGIYLALPRSLIVGPTWLLPTLMLVLLIPTVITHRMGRRSPNRALGLIINSIITLALMGSVALLVVALPSHKGRAVAVAWFGRRALGYERPGFRTLVLATRWWRANRSSRTPGVWEPQLPLPANAN